MGLADGIRTTYGQAAKEARKKLDNFFAAYRQKAEQKLKQLQDGVISDEEYRRWMQSQMLTGRRWQEKLDDITKTYVDADKTARELVGDRSKNVFARFANSTARDIQNRFKGGVSFDMYDRHAVERLLTQNPRMLPEWKINEAKDYRWNAKRVQNAVVQGIIQGESIPQLTKRLTSELSAANAKHMTLFARTAMTGAQNAGRMERLHEAQDMGIVVKKKWLAAHDDRVRDAHAELDGQEVGIDEPFHSSLGDIMYPGDPAADPANIYNCRCTLTYVYDVKKSAENLREKQLYGDGDTSTGNQAGTNGSGVASNGDRYAYAPSTLGGTTRGEPMSFREANNRAANPGYRVGTGTAKNCQSCVVAHEARLRGYDVEARSYNNNQIAELLAQDPRIAWIDPDTGYVPEYVDWDAKKRYDFTSFKQFLEDNVEKGKRYTLDFQWKGNEAGHIVSIDRDGNGALRIYDPQSGKTYNSWTIDRYIERMDIGRKNAIGQSDPPHLLRVDNLSFNENVVNDVLTEERAGWKRVVKKTEDDDEWTPF